MRQQKTIRKLAPTARRLAHLVNDLQVTAKRIDKLIPEIDRYERDSNILMKASHRKVEQPEIIDWHESGIGTQVKV